MSLEVYFFQGGVLDDVKVVEFDSVDPHPVQESRSVEDLSTVFCWKSEDQVDAESKVPCLGPSHCIDEFLHSMTSIDPLKGLVIHGLQP